MRGPAGVGKSAVAQTCAEALGDKLGATFFFSRPNERDDPNRFLPTISYQLAMKHEGYRRIIGITMHNNPSLVAKSIRQQFHDLFVVPLRQLEAENNQFEKKVIIIDGLDECEGNEVQRDIVEIVAGSVQVGTTPFLWAFFSRPETHIVAIFTSLTISSLVFHLELPVTREIDHEIAQYLSDELEEVRKENQLPLPWPTKKDIGTLVKLSAGLFIYAATIVRFIREPDSLSPEDQLAAVLSLVRRPSHSWSGSEHPLLELDLFYTMIMQRIPPRVLQTTQKVLLVAVVAPSGRDAIENANLLGLSEIQLLSACRGLRSVLSITEHHPAPSAGRSQGREFRIRCYHASFMDFLGDPTRSKQYCALSWATALRNELLDKLTLAHENDSGELIALAMF